MVEAPLRWVANVFLRLGPIRFRATENTAKEYPTPNKKTEPYCGWTKSISHHLETMVETIRFIGIIPGDSNQKPGFLGVHHSETLVSDSNPAKIPINLMVSTMVSKCQGCPSSQPSLPPPLVGRGHRAQRRAGAAARRGGGGGGLEPGPDLTAIGQRIFRLFTFCLKLGWVFRTYPPKKVDLWFLHFLWGGQQQPSRGHAAWRFFQPPFYLLGSFSVV